MSKDTAISQYRALLTRLDVMDEQIRSRITNDSAFKDFRSRINTIRTIISGQVTSLAGDDTALESGRVASDIATYSDITRSLQRLIDEYSESSYDPPVMLPNADPYIFNISQSYLRYTTPKFKLEQRGRGAREGMVIPVQATVICEDCAEFYFNTALEQDPKEPLYWQLTMTASSYDIVQKRARELNGKVFNLSLRLEGEGAPASVSFTITTQVQ